MDKVTLRDSTCRLRKSRSGDLSVIEEAIALRATSVVEFAAISRLDELTDALQAGQELTERLLEERRVLFAELANARGLLHALTATDNSHVQANSFMG